VIFDQTEPPRFWTRNTVLFALGGLFAYGLSLWLFQIGSPFVVVLVSVIRLFLGLAPSRFIAQRMGWQPATSWHAGALAAPYPLELALLAYSKRFAFLPDSLVPTLSGPTVFLIFITSVLLVSRWTTVWALPADIRRQKAESLRFLGGLLLVLTAIGVVLVPSPWSLLFLHYVPEPIALAGYCALTGRGTKR